MNTCNSCGFENTEDARFCAKCGGVIKDSDAALSEEQNCLNDYYRFFKYERLTWKITGFVYLGLTLTFFGLALLFLIISLLSNSTFADASMATLFGLYSFYGILILPTTIVNLKMISRAEYYMKTLYTDIRPTITRTSSVGMLVLAGIFNGIALVFIIINFVRTKTNSHLLNRILYRQGQ